MLRFKWGEFGEINPIKCIDSNGADVNIAFADETKTKVYILSENKTKILLTISDGDFDIVTPNINWTPTKTQSETMPPGNYAGEAHLQDTGLTRNTVCEFPVFVEKAQGNI